MFISALLLLDINADIMVASLEQVIEPERLRRVKLDDFFLFFLKNKMLRNV